MAKARILALAGSLRKDSFNKKLIRLAVVAARDTGAEVTLVDLADLRMPVYDGDLEASDGVPEAARKLRGIMLEHRGLLIASPELNSSVSGAFKNVIDWVSRPDQGVASTAAFQGKVAGIMSASTGALGGLRGLVHLRSILGNVGVLVLPEQATVSKAGEAFDEAGALKDAKQAEGVKKVVGRVVEVAGRLHG
ncbi:MAG TPA: NAD(P)H-dependent oxidoreductase [Phycisphaerales bacterium]|nr:NAD(P)H-dependent oxidoreductase [Phycisphaerales bacterium]